MSSFSFACRALFSSIVVVAIIGSPTGSLLAEEGGVLQDASEDASSAKGRSFGTIGAVTGWSPGLVPVVAGDATWPAAAGAAGDCPAPTVLISGVVETAPPPRQYYLFDQPTTYWTVVGVRQPEADWDVAVYENPDGNDSPICFSGSLALSQLVGVVDLVVGDFNHDTPARYYTRCYRFSGAGDAAMEWDDGADELMADGPLIGGSTGPDDVLEIWDIALEQGTEYRFELNVSGAASVKLLLFKNPADDVYWAPRSWAEFLTTGPVHQYVCSRTDRYGLILVNDNGEAGTYELSVESCPDAAIELSSGVAVPTPDPGAHYSFDQTHGQWSAVGTRQTTADWEVTVYGGLCRADSRGTSQGIAAVDFVVGDFNHNAVGVHFVDALIVGAPAGDAVTEWDDGPDELVIDGGAIVLNTGATDVLEVWDVALEAGEDYQFVFEPEGLAALRLFLFRSNDGEYWADRTLREVESTESFVYEATATDRYGVVVVNENGEPGSYTLEIQSSVVAVTDAPAPVITTSRLLPIAPNPSLGAVRLEFRLAEADRVGFELVDVTGRVVAETSSHRSPGDWTTTWDIRNAVGPGLRSGVYWLRMTVGGRQVDAQKLLLID